MARSAIPADKNSRPDWYQEVTDSLVREMEAAIANGSSWAKGWSGLWKYGLPMRGNVMIPFTGINVWILALASDRKGYTDPRWFTFDQAKEKVGYTKNPEWKGKCDTYKGIKKWIWTGDAEADPHLGVRAGETGTHVIRINPIPQYADRTGKKVYPPKGDRTAWEARIASGDVRQTGVYVSIKSYCVFNAAQIDGMPQVEMRDIQPGEAYLNAQILTEILGTSIKHLDGCDDACYSPIADTITLPAPGQFKTEAHYWATLLHEIVHWTGHASRLDRGMHLSGSEEYAFEELVAEIGSAFLCAHLGIEGDLRHPEYLAAWIKRLQGDSKAIFKAATLAQKAVDFIVNGGRKVSEISETDEEEDSEAA